MYYIRTLLLCLFKNSEFYQDKINEKKAPILNSTFHSITVYGRNMRRRTFVQVKFEVLARTQNCEGYASVNIKGGEL